MASREAPGEARGIKLSCPVVLLASLLLISHFFHVAESAACSATMAADTEALVPAYLKSLDAPVASIQVSFPVAGKMQFGALYLFSQIQDTPSVLLQGAGLKSWEIYTLMTVDPDSGEYAPTTNILHLLVVNIPGWIGPSQDAVKVGDVWVSWLSPAVPKDTVIDGCHRHMYLLFGQGKQKITVGSPYPNFGFSVLNFTSQFGLGSPFAGFPYRDYPDIFY